jgi:hypothetical protein
MKMVKIVKKSPGSDTGKRLTPVTAVAGGGPGVSSPKPVKSLQLRKQKERINIASAWNVRSMYQPGKLENVILEMKRLNIDVLGVSEMRWKGRNRITLEEQQAVTNTSAVSE